MSLDRDRMIGAQYPPAAGHAAGAPWCNSQPERLDESCMAFYRDLKHAEQRFLFLKEQFERVVAQIYQVQPNERFVIEPDGTIHRAQALVEELVPRFAEPPRD